MTLPNVSMTIADGATATAPPATGLPPAYLGICTKGVAGTVYQYGDVGAMVSALGEGPLVEAGALYLATTRPAAPPKPLILVPVTPSTLGTNGSVTHAGTGAMTATPSCAPRRTITVTCVTTGVAGVATFTFQIGSDTASAPVTSAAGWTSTGYIVPGTLTKLVFTDGTGFDSTDAWTISNIGVVTHTVTSGVKTGSIAQTSSPLDRYDVRIVVTTAGALQTSEFKYSLDDGDNYIGPIVTVASGKHALGDSGVYVVFSGTAVAGDYYTWTATEAVGSTANYQAAAATLLAEGLTYDHVLVTGRQADSAAGAAMATAIDTSMGLAEVAFNYTFAIIPQPHAESDATIKAAYLTFASSRIGVACGDTEQVSPLSARIERRPGAWAYSARLGAIGVSDDPLAVAFGPIQYVTDIYRDERATPGLDTARFVTTRSWVGAVGDFFTRGRMMAATGSDFADVDRRRVMDAACRITYASMLQKVGAKLRLKTDGTGYIDERDAVKIEARCQADLNAQLVSKGHCSGASIVVSRTTDLTSAETPLPVEVRVVPVGHARFISVTIGYSRTL